MDEDAHQDRIARIAASAGGLVATASDDHTVRLWDVASGKQRLQLKHGGWVRAVALSPDGSRVGSSSLDDTVRLWDARTGREIYRLAGHGKFGGRRSIGFTPDGKRLLSWGDDFRLRVWDVRNAKALLDQALRPHGVKVPDKSTGPQERQMLQMRLSMSEGSFSADGKVFVLATREGLHVIAVETGREVRAIETAFRSLATLPGSISGPVAFSADSKTYAAATDKPTGKIRLWEAATGKERPAIAGFRGGISALAFSADGRYLISGMNDTTALVWDLTAKR